MSTPQITSQPTPNPNAYKFTTNHDFNTGCAEAFYSAESAQEHPLAAKLFAIPGVTGVMFLSDFCSVNKEPDAEWETLCPQIETVLQESLG